MSVPECTAEPMTSVKENGLVLQSSERKNDGTYDVECTTVSTPLTVCCSSSRNSGIPREMIDQVESAKKGKKRMVELSTADGEVVQNRVEEKRGKCYVSLVIET